MLRQTTAGQFSSSIHDQTKNSVSSRGVIMPIPQLELPQIFGLMDCTEIDGDLQSSGLLAHESCMSLPQKGRHLYC